MVILVKKKSKERFFAQHVKKDFFAQHIKLAAPQAVRQSIDVSVVLHLRIKGYTADRIEKRKKHSTR